MNPLQFVFKRLPQALSLGLVLTALFSTLSSTHAAVFTARNPISNGGLGVTTANIMAVNPDGIGHLLLVPYYSAQNGNATILSVTNMDAQNGKAVKVRFRGAANGDTVFDLTVFLAPNDVWNAVVTQNPVSGLAQLSTAETSCTLPSMSSGVTYPFYTSRLNTLLNANDQASQTREGYIEVLTMADIQPITTAGALFQSISSVNGKPVNCTAPSVLATLVDAPTESVAGGMGFAAPTTGLEGNWTLINVPKTLTFSGNATAVQALDNTTGKPARANYVLFPQSNAVIGGVDALTSDPLLRSNPFGTKTAAGVTTPYAPAVGGLPVVTALQYDFPDLSTPYLAALTMPHLQSVALSTALAAKSVANDFTIEPNVLAATDWVFTLPTKRYSVGTDYRQTPPARVYHLGAGRGGVEFFSDNAATQPDAVPALYFNRDGERQSVVGKPNAVVLKGATSVLTFGATLSALGASVTNDNARGLTFANGWGTLDVSNGGAGLPVLGTALIRATNPAAAPGVSGNYGITSDHRYTR